MYLIFHGNVGLLGKGPAAALLNFLDHFLCGIVPREIVYNYIRPGLAESYRHPFPDSRAGTCYQ